jgi:serine phosphatase RsbU (regulator of sigma subunit)
MANQRAAIDTSLQRRYYIAMISPLMRVARRLWPDFDQLTDYERVRLLGDLALTLLSLPLVVGSLLLLAAVSDLEVMRTQWPAALMILGLGFSLSRLSFFQIFGTRAEHYSFVSSTLMPVLAISALLLFGPSTIWLLLALEAPNYVPLLLKAQSRPQRWTLARNWLYNTWVAILSLLLVLLVYRLAGGTIPLPGLTWQTSWPALLAVLAFMALQMASLLLLITVQGRLQRTFGQLAALPRRRQTIVFFLASEVSAFFGVMAAALYSQNGVWAYLFFMLGVHLVSLLARRLSKAAMLAQQRTREMTQLERLGRAIIAAPPDASALPDLLAEYVPTMFRYHRMEIRLFSGQTLLSLPAGQPAIPEQVWQWLHERPDNYDIDARQVAPWDGHPAGDRLVLSPILASEDGRPLGGIYLAQEINIFEDLSVDLQPALQALASQIGSNLRSADAYRRNLEHQLMAQELAVAGQIQATFLPPTLPALPGWQLVAALQPARETSGDFYDAFTLPNGKLGLLVADVSDKGMGAALVMALTRTLLRTYAYEYHSRPDYVLRVANRRILADTQSGLFVSVFYGVIDPLAGAVTYANAGHNPPYLLRNHGSTSTELLKRTGMVLGVMEGVEWQAQTVPFDPGDMLVAYSDGVSDALSEADEFFGEQRLRNLVEQHRHESAEGMLTAIVEAQRSFVGRTPWFDDATLMVLKRD